ncbi:ABC transporter ATP-binding protein [Gordonia sp. VNK1]|uniref:ABC transporter ATP-binding protein n=1 Tax=Gordonia oleivorans TaxID=3156618 RepID=UPI0032B568F6
MTSAHAELTQPSGTAVAAGAEDLTKVYGTGDTAVHALRGVTVGFAKSEFTAIMGPSGSGKSTLMHCLAGLDEASGGRAYIGDVALTGLSDKEMTKLRRDRIGFVFQSFNLVPTLTAAENITLPLDIAGRDVDREWFDTVVGRLGIGDRLGHLPTELSGGQQQRVACARALVGRPDIIFGDEPTGNLDSRSSGEVLSILRAATDEFGQTVVIVTHDPRAASYADRVVFLADGNIVRELTRPTADDVFEVMRHLDDDHFVTPESPSTTDDEDRPRPILSKTLSGAPAADAGVGRHQAADQGSDSGDSDSDDSSSGDSDPDTGPDGAAPRGRHEAR